VLKIYKTYASISTNAKFYWLFLYIKPAGTLRDQFCKTRLIIVSGAAASHSGTAARGLYENIESKENYIFCRKLAV